MPIYKFNKNDAVLIINGAFRSWVGYAQGHEDKDSGLVQVKIFACDGEAYQQEFDIDYVKNLEEFYTPSWKE